MIYPLEQGIGRVIYKSIQNSEPDIVSNFEKKLLLEHLLLNTTSNTDASAALLIVTILDQSFAVQM